MKIPEIMLDINSHEVKSSEIDAVETQSLYLSDEAIIGIGGRVKINNNGNILTIKINLPVMKTKYAFYVYDGTPSIYAGFSGSIDANVGFEYNGTLNVWQPTMSVEGFGDASFNNGSDQFNDLNGFLPGTQIQLTIYRNINGATKAIYQGNSNIGYIDKAILEIPNTNIKPSQINNWKLLSTVTGDRIKVDKQYQVKFTNIVIDNIIFKPIADAKKQAYISVSHGNAIITINRSKIA